MLLSNVSNGLEQSRRFSKMSEIQIMELSQSACHNLSMSFGMHLEPSMSIINTTRGFIYGLILAQSDNLSRNNKFCNSVLSLFLVFLVAFLSIVIVIVIVMTYE